MTATLEPGWSPDERALLLASVGGGAHERPLTPAGVGDLMAREAARGVKHDAMATALHLDSAAMIGRFIRVAGLAPEIAANVGWGKSAKWINLTQAQEVARLASARDQRELARLVLEYRLSGTEVRGAVQICLRRGADVSTAVEETVRLRPAIERRYVQIGSIRLEATRRAIAPMSAEDRSLLMRRILHGLGLQPLDATLNERGYAIVLDQQAGEAADADRMERDINQALEAEVGVG